MSVGAVATPLLFVVAVAFADPLNAALAPVEGAVNVTVTPLTGLLLASLTVASSAVPNAALIVALCGVPAVAAILPAAPGVFRASESQAADGAGATVYRASNNSLVSPLNPVQAGDDLVIYAAGLGRTLPAIRAGEAAPADPLSVTVIPPEVTLDGEPLTVGSAALMPGGIGIYQINVKAPPRVADGDSVPLTIRQGGMSTTVAVQVAVQ